MQSIYRTADSLSSVFNRLNKYTSINSLTASILQSILFEEWKWKYLKTRHPFFMDYFWICLCVKKYHQIHFKFICMYIIYFSVSTNPFAMTINNTEAAVNPFGQQQTTTNNRVPLNQLAASQSTGFTQPASSSLPNPLLPVDSAQMAHTTNNPFLWAAIGGK